MVQELKTTNQANNGRRSIDLSALGEAATASIVSETKEKPKLLDPVLAKIKGTDIVMTDRLEHNKDDETKIYYAGYFTVETEFEHEGETVTSKDSFGGLRFYVKMDETRSPMSNADGSPIIERLWIGDRSQLGKLLKLVQDHDDSVVSYSDFLGYFKEGMSVMIQTLFTTYQGQQKWKQQIVEIL